ncbi:photosystem II stability/assembly factor-like uncharacterized protein [Deinobacterium chartae]|uniref:Photosystem II stability/assembly factor-like uncharacterized protein n=1 Tax=Deinobacterium chartae TaxID=521158 RepID=A0A841I308_9DEIO|nr:hypothetical protein [Deinobacterium chartae]MBB6098738.1 photosystem II stability/assembly factor-like uncharacterized protein [Deinobacterium chartae]
MRACALLVTVLCGLLCGARAAPDITGFALVSPLSGWVFTAHGVRRSGDGGRSWVNVTPPLPRDADPEVRFVGDAVSASLAWVVLTGERRRTRILSTSDGGKSWQVRSLPVPNVGAVIDFRDPHEGTLRLTQRRGMNTAPFVAYRTRDGGHSWQAVTRSVSDTLKSPAARGLLSDRCCAEHLTFVGENAAFISGRFGTPDRPYFLSSFDGGRNWSDVTTPLPSSPSRVPHFGKPRFFDDRNGRVVATLPPRPQEPGELALLATADGGRSWSALQRLPLPAGTAPLPPLASFPDTETALLWNGQLLLSQDGGRSFDPVPGEGLEAPSVLQFASAQVGWALERGQIKATYDGGRSWNALSFRDGSEEP